MFDRGARRQDGAVAGEEHRFPFGEDSYFISDAEAMCVGVQALDGFFHGFAAQAEGAEVHGNHPFGTGLNEAADGFFGRGVDGAIGVGEVRADGEQGNVWVEASADLGETVEVGGVPGVVDAGTTNDWSHYVAPVFSVHVAEHARSPMLARGHSDLQAKGFQFIPPTEGVESFEAHPFDEVGYAVRDDDFWCRTAKAAGGADDSTQGGFVEVVHVGVGDEDEIDGREVADEDAGAALAAQDYETGGKDWIYKDIFSANLEEEGRVAEKGDAGLAAGGDLGETGFAGEGLFVTFANEADELIELLESQWASPSCGGSGHRVVLLDELDAFGFVCAHV